MSLVHGELLIVNILSTGVNLNELSVESFKTSPELSLLLLDIIEEVAIWASSVSLWFNVESYLQEIHEGKLFVIVVNAVLEVLSFNIDFISLLGDFVLLILSALLLSSSGSFSLELGHVVALNIECSLGFSLLFLLGLVFLGGLVSDSSKLTLQGVSLSFLGGKSRFEIADLSGGG